MPELPNIRYNSNFTLSRMGTFHGIQRKDPGEEASMYEALNVSNINYPALSTRLGFARVNMKDSNNDPLTISEDIIASSSLDGDGIMLVGTTKYWFYSYAQGYWTQGNLPETISGRQRIMAYKWGYDGGTSGVIHYRYFTYVLFPSKIAVSHWTSQTGTQAAKHFVSSAKLDKVTSPNSNSNNRGEIRDANNDVVIFTNADESVLTSVSSLAGVLPGFTYKVTKKPYNTADPTVVTYAHAVLYRAQTDSDAVYISTAPGAYADTVVFDDPNAAFEADSVDFYPGTVTVEPNYPKYVEGAFAVNNRIWAYGRSAKDGPADTIYASGLGVTGSFDVDGTDYGGWSVKLVLGEDITAGICYAGHPVFFTERHIITAYGDYPSNFGLSYTSANGVAKESPDSLCVCGGYLYYLSEAGVMRYGGNMPQKISEGLTLRNLTNGVGCTDGINYYLYAEFLNRHNDTYKGVLYCLDTEHNTWQKLDYQGTYKGEVSPNADKPIKAPVMTCVANTSPSVNEILLLNNDATDGARALYCVPSQERQPLLSGALTSTYYEGYNDSYKWYARFGPFTNPTAGNFGGTALQPNVKWILQMQLRVRALMPTENGSTFTVRICYDDADARTDYYDDPVDTASSDAWGTLYTETVTDDYKLRNIYIPVYPRRYDSFKVELSGTGRWIIYSMAIEYQPGSERR